MNELVPWRANGQLSAPLVQRTEIVASTLESIEQAELMSFYRKHPELFIADVQNHYPLSWSTIDQYHQNCWNWRWLSSNPNLDWRSHRFFDETEELHEFGEPQDCDWRWGLDFFSDKWDWRQLSRNEGLPWSFYLLDEYIHHWDWKQLSLNKALPWSFELLDRYIDHWNWLALGFNESIPWSIELLERYADRWDWNGLSATHNLPWSVQFIGKFLEKWDWCELSHNSSLPFSEELIDRFSDKWNWPFLGGMLSDELLSKYREHGLGPRLKPPWTVEKLTEVFGGRDHGWESFVRAELTPEFIYKHRDRFDWTCLSEDCTIESDQWSEEIIEKCQDSFNWNYLSRDYNGIIDINFLRKFEHKLNWENLSENYSVDWTYELLKQFETKLNFSKIAPCMDLVKDILTTDQVDQLLSETIFDYNFRTCKKFDRDQIDCFGGLTI